MTLDEAIAHEREVAKEKRKEMQCKTCKLFARSDLHPLQGYCRKNEFRSIEIDSWSKVCSEYVPKEMCKCAEEHEQLAEWLEELKKYQKYGTPDGYGAALKAYDDCYFEKEEISNELQEYKQLGTLEEVRDAVEKQKAKKPIIQPWSPARCPTCGEELSENLGDGYYANIEKEDASIKNIESCKIKAIEGWNRRVSDE